MKLFQRIETAIILVVILIPIFVYGSWPLQLAILFLACRGLFEILRMIDIPFYSLPSLLAHLSIAFIVFSDRLGPKLPTYLEVQHMIALMTLLMLISATVHQSFTFIDAGIAVLGIIYIGYGFYSMYYIREQDGFLLILIVLATVISDTGAYLIGSFFGKHKLAPILSPNKTIEGSLGGVLASGFLIFIIVSLFPFLPMTPVVGGLIAIIIAIASQFGDLIESGMKREFNVKDTGTILPGHGGILDRFDSLIFATTLALILGIV